MASMRDAMKRLEAIYNACAPEAIEKNKEEATLDEFSRLRKTIHAQVRQVREVVQVYLVFKRKRRDDEGWKNNHRVG